MDTRHSLYRELENSPSGGIKQTLGRVLTFSQSTSTSSRLSNSLIRSSVGILIKDPLLPSRPSPCPCPCAALCEGDEKGEEEERGESYCDALLNLDKIDLGLGGGNGFPSGRGGAGR